MPGDHDYKKKKKELKEKLAKIGADNKRGDVDVDKNEQYKSVATNEYYNKHDADMGGYNKDILDKVQLKNQKKIKKGKKVPQDKIRETPTKENNYQTHMDSKGAFEQRALKEKVKKAELTDVTDQQKKKRKDKDKLIHQARGMGVIPTYSKSKVKKTPPQGPSGGTADNPDDIIKDAEAVARKNDTYIGKLKEKIASKKKEQERRILKETEEEEEIRHQKISQEHDHSITFKGYKGESYKRASLISNTGKYAKYWLLNAKQTNGNGWGVSQQSIAKNIHKFVGKPLVVTAKSWIPDSEYGDAYEHPYLPTNDINKVFDHQEKFRVGSIVDIIEKDGDYFANIELNQKFAHMVMPPFCSPAIFQNNPSEPEGQIEDWEALHLAALHEDPAYGSRIALLRGTCVGTKDQCTVQFKSAKQEAKMVCTKGLKERIAGLFPNEKRHWEEQGYKTKPDWYGDTCPGCGQEILEFPSLSREDNKTSVCTNCGEKEAYGEFSDVKSQIDLQGHEENKSKKLRKSKPGGFYSDRFGGGGKLGGLKKNEKTSDQAIDDVIKDIKDPDLREDAINRLDKTSVGPKNYTPSLKDKIRRDLGTKSGALKKKPIGIIPRGKKISELTSRTLTKRMKEDYKKGGGMPKNKKLGEKYIENVLNKPNRPDTEDPPAAMYMTKENAKKYSKLKQRLAAVQQLTLEGEPAPERVKGRQRKVAKTKEEVIKAMKEGKPMRTNTPLRYGERLPPTYRTDGKSFFLYNNKILSKQGNGYQTHVKDFINNDNYEQITLNTLRDFGIQVNSEGKIIPTKKFFTKDGLAMKIKTKGDLTKKDMVIPANEISDNRVLVNKYKSSTGIKPDTYPYTPENLHNFSAESRRRATSMQVDSEGKTVPVGTLKGDPTGINKRSLSETATQPEDAKTVNKILGLPEEQGLEKTFGKKKYNKKKTKTTYNKGEYQGIEGSKTHHILFKDTFKGKKHPLDRFKHTRNVKATPKGSFARPFANNPRNPIQVSKPEHKEIHNLNPHSGFRYILESKLKQRLSKILDNKE